MSHMDDGMGCLCCFFFAGLNDVQFVDIRV